MQNNVTVTLTHFQIVRQGRKGWKHVGCFQHSASKVVQDKHMFRACRGEFNLVIAELYNYQFTATLNVGTEDKTK